MRHDRALNLAERIRRLSHEARVLVLSGNAGRSALFVSLHGRTVRIDRISDWREHFQPGADRGEWRARETAQA